jgi:hypothetical protein
MLDREMRRNLKDRQIGSEIERQAKRTDQSAEDGYESSTTGGVGAEGSGNQNAHCRSHVRQALTDDPLRDWHMCVHSVATPSKVRRLPMVQPFRIC